MTSDKTQIDESAFLPFEENPEANPIFVWLGKMSLKLFGWQVGGQLPETNRFVVIGAPHTSNWDLPIGLCLMLVFGKKIHWMMKASVFWPPLGWFFKAIGGMPIDREKRNNLVNDIVEQFERNESLIIGITPEGTRSRVENWKTGFYYVAYKAQVPIVMGYFDYKRKIAGLGPAIFPSGDIEADQKRFQDFYGQSTPKHPHLFASVQFSPESIKRFKDSLEPPNQ